MSITYYMLQISPVILFFVTIVVSGFLAGLFTYIFRKYVNLKILRSHNEVTGFLFLAIASFYALLLSFVVLIVWDQLNETHNNASKEGSSALGLYRDIKFYPDTLESKKLMIAYLDFVYNVIDDEFPSMEKMQSSTKTTLSFNNVFREMERLNPKNPIQIQLVTEMFRHLNELSTYRGLRNSSLETEIPPPIWLPIILGALITIFCAMLLDVEHVRLHVSLNTMLGIFIAVFLFIIVLLDHPYTGSLSIKPKSYQKIFTLEQQLNHPTYNTIK
jgi:predicted PurR-regulated permease PerM